MNMQQINDLRASLGLEPLKRSDVKIELERRRKARAERNRQARAQKNRELQNSRSSRGGK